MNVEWMVQRLEDFLELCEEANSLYRAGYYEPQDLKEVEDGMFDALPTAEQIITRTDPRLLTDDLGKTTAPAVWKTAIQTRQAIGILRDREDWKINLEPDALSLAADELHPMIW